MTAAASASPVQQQNLSNFFLVTSTARDPISPSSLLPSVNATSLFDADRFGDDLYQLRLIAPGYNSLPRFNLTDNALHTIAYGVGGKGEYDYESTEVDEGEELEFDPTPEGEEGNLELKEGYLLAVDGECGGWTVCEGEMGQNVVSYCVSTIYARVWARANI